MILELLQAGAVLVVAGLVLVSAVREYAGDEPTDVEQAIAAYRDGYINEAELDDRLELAMDPEAERIRVATEAINGIGPATSADLALAFDSLEELRRADHDDLTDVHGIGPSTAEAVNQHLTQR
jgi:NAD-dependent DNA ligase